MSFSGRLIQILFGRLSTFGSLLPSFVGQFPGLFRERSSALAALLGGSAALGKAQEHYNEGQR